MKKLILLFLLSLTAIPFTTKAQAPLTPVPLPYATGFDSSISTTSLYSWNQWKGNDGNVTNFKWAITASASAPSAPNVLLSPNAALTDTALADTISQWYVSPPLDLQDGGTINSISINVFTPNCSAIASDSILLYLIKGSSLPSVSYGNVLLANLTGMATCDHVFRDTGNFTIPISAFPFSCIAFKYYAVHDSFQVSIDNINISGTPGASVGAMHKDDEVALYPNPASTHVQIVLKNNKNTNGSVTLCNILGERVLKQDFTTSSQPIQMDISAISPGIYYAEIVTAGNERYVQKLLVTR